MKNNVKEQWFAWYPVRLHNTKKIVFFRTVYREPNLFAIDSNNYFGLNESEWYYTLENE